MYSGFYLGPWYRYDLCLQERRLLGLEYQVLVLDWEGSVSQRGKLLLTVYWRGVEASWYMCLRMLHLEPQTAISGICTDVCEDTEETVLAAGTLRHDHAGMLSQPSEH